MSQTSSQYIEEQLRAFSLYTMQMRAIPAITDGLKAGGRRVLWMARDGKHYKSATLAGSAMPIHPHASPESSVDTLTAPFGNNYPLFAGDGAFGTMLTPFAFGASRYTSVEISAFTKDVVLADIDIVPMMLNYDNTEQEPVHFLPLIPLCLVNPAEGIAVGFSTNILPRALDDIIKVQLAHLTGGKKTLDILPKFIPLDSTAVRGEKDGVFVFAGKYEKVTATSVRITGLPYGLEHKHAVAKLDKLLDTGQVLDVEDNSKNTINILVKFKKGVLTGLDDDAILKLLGLVAKHTENLNVLDFSGKSIVSYHPVELIQKFTDWRLTWYVVRYQRLLDLLMVDIQRLYDIRTAIKHKIGAVASKTQSRSELKELLETIGVVNLDYIADLAVYRFTEAEREKNEQRIAEAEKQAAEYTRLISDPESRKMVYVKELNDILAANKKGKYLIN